MKSYPTPPAPPAEANRSAPTGLEMLFFPLFFSLRPQASHTHFSPSISFAPTPLFPAFFRCSLSLLRYCECMYGDMGSKLAMLWFAVSSQILIFFFLRGCAQTPSSRRVSWKYATSTIFVSLDRHVRGGSEENIIPKERRKRKNETETDYHHNCTSASSISSPFPPRGDLFSS
jgi:hypothetical protein